MIARREFLVMTGASIGGWVIGSPASATPAAQTARATDRPLTSSLEAMRMDATEPPLDASQARDTPTLAIFDPARASGCQFADDATQRGHVVLPLEGDAGAFWYRTVLPLLARSSDIDRQTAHRTSHVDPLVLSTLASTRMAAPDLEASTERWGGMDNPPGTTLPRYPVLLGLTSHADFFVLSTLAASAGMTVSSHRRSHDMFPAPAREPTNGLVHAPTPDVTWRCAFST